MLTAATRIFHSIMLFGGLVLVLYALGNYQEFLDESQVLLLRLSRTAALAGTILGAYCLGYRVLRLARRRASGFLPLAADALLLALSGALLAGVEMLFAWLQIPAA